MLKLQTLEDAGQLTVEFCKEWAQLHGELLYATPFQTPEWLVTWWRHFGGGQIQILTFRDESGRLCAVIPCFLHDWEGRCQLTLIGSGISDYLDPLILKDVESDVIAQVATYLQGSQDWQVCKWQDLSVSSPFTKLRLSSDVKLEIEPDEVCSVIPLMFDFEAYWEGRPSGLRRNVRRYSQKATELSAVQFEQVEGYSRQHQDALIALHTRRWREQGEPGMVQANHSGEFLRQVSQAMALTRSVMFFALKFQGQIAAVIQVFPHREQLFAYLSAFDPAYNALGLGRILLYRALQFASHAGYRSWNFLRGREPYKSDWGALPIGKVRITIRRAPVLKQ